MLISLAPWHAIPLYLVVAFVFVTWFRNHQPGLRIPGPWAKPLCHKKELFMDIKGAVIDEPLEGGPRIRQASMVFPDNAVYERTMKTHVNHGKKWGYPTHLLKQDIIGDKAFTKLGLDKISYLQSLIVREMAKPFSKRSEWIVWVDADTILLNQNVPWSLFLPPSEEFSDIHLLGAKDWSGFNCGVFFVRVNERNVRMLADVTALPSLRPDIELGDDPVQDAMKWVFNREGYAEHVLYQPLHWYNGYGFPSDTPVVAPGDLLVHFAGIGGPKYSTMGKWLDRLEGEEGSEWNPPLIQTKYEYEINNFWSRLRAARNILKEAEDLAAQNYPNITEKAVSDKVTTAHSKLQDLVRNDAFKGEQIVQGVQKLKVALDAAIKEQAAKQKAIEMEYVRQEQAATRKPNEDRKKNTAEQILEAEKQKYLPGQEQHAKEEEQQKAEQAICHEAKQEFEAEEAQQKTEAAKGQKAQEQDDGGDSGSTNQIARAMEMEEQKRQEKERVKAEMMKKNNIDEAVVTDGKN